MAATLNAVSGGRTVLGIGAGHPMTEAEHPSFGLDFPPIKERMDRLEVVLPQLRELTSAAIPILVAGSEEHRVLRIVAPMPTSAISLRPQATRWTWFATSSRCCGLPAMRAAETTVRSTGLTKKGSCCQRRRHSTLRAAHIHQRRPPRGTIAHSDQGSQFSSLSYGRRLREAGLVASMAAAGDANDNAMAEAFFATLGGELLDQHRFQTRDQARMAVFDFIEGWYNTQRRHSSLMLSPAKFESVDGMPRVSWRR